ncbi:MAG: DUF2924 domain-containing protein [Erythrobacter sp.]|nr:DUF2924 domain-containing protein [Erythrobacter sp.]MDZ4273294.1 DUF2924 domain-containing protein [Erythrobacter sp.]
MNGELLQKLGTMPPAELRAAWREQYRSPAPDLGPDLLRRGIAWRMQERTAGKLSPTTRREIERMIARLNAGEEPAKAGAAKLKPGTRLIRSWGGAVHQVLVLEDGFEHEGRHYRNLSQIARAITGAHWSGPRFFGLKASHG